MQPKQKFLLERKFDGQLKLTVDIFVISFSCTDLDNVCRVDEGWAETWFVAEEPPLMFWLNMVSVMTLLRDPSRTSGASDPFLPLPLRVVHKYGCIAIIEFNSGTCGTNLLYALANSRRSAEITGAATAARGWQHYIIIIVIFHLQQSSAFWHHYHCLLSHYLHLHSSFELDLSRLIAE